MSVPRNGMKLDRRHTALTGFCADPSFSQVPIEITTTKVFKVNPTADEISSGMIDITGWICMRISTSADIQLYLNGESTKYITLTSGTKEEYILHDDVTTVTLSGAATVKIEGM